MKLKSLVSIATLAAVMATPTAFAATPPASSVWA